jgi:hypothetical protein
VNGKQSCIDAVAQDGLESGTRAQLEPGQAMSGTEVPEVVAEALDSLAIRANDGIVRNERRRGRVLGVNQFRLLVQHRVDVLVGNDLYHDGSEPAVRQELQPFEAIARVEKI